MEESRVRELIAEVTAPDGTPLISPQQITSIGIEAEWITVLLTEQPVPQRTLSRLHQHLSKNLSGDFEIELRCGGRVFRGGYGFGRRRHVIAVLGGKGGVGKSTVTVNLSLTLAAMGFRVGVLDGDLNGPDIPHMLGVHPRRDRTQGRWRLDAIHNPQERRKPYERLGLEVMSVGFVVPERNPLTLTGWLVSGVLRNLLFDVTWQADVIVIDAPPGTGEEIQVMVRELPLSGAVFVTTPQDLAQMDAERTLAHLTEHGVPVIGMVQNMASLNCPHCTQTIDLYAESKRLEDAGVRVLGRIPFDTRLSVTADRGLPLVLGDPRGPIAFEFARIGTAVRRWLAQRDRELLDEHAA